MIYAFIDTNIWIRVLSQGRPGCELEHINVITQLLRESKLRLVLPELIELELERRWRVFTDDITKNFAELTKRLQEVLNKNKIWSEIQDVYDAIPGFVETRRKQKLESANNHYEQIQLLFRLPAVLKVPLTSELWFAARKRVLAGRMPSAEQGGVHNDSCHIESLLAHFKTDWPEGAKLCFCTENLRDFALLVKEENILHPLIANGLPPTKIVATLRALVEFHKSDSAVIEPTKKDIDEALQAKLISLDESRYCIACAHAGESQVPRFLGNLCHSHLLQHIKNMLPSERTGFEQALNRALKTLTYREREVIKLRAGLGADGYCYTREEVAHIFRASLDDILEIESIAIRKLRTHTSMRHIAIYFDDIVNDPPYDGLFSDLTDEQE